MVKLEPRTTVAWAAILLSTFTLIAVSGFSSIHNHLQVTHTSSSSLASSVQQVLRRRPLAPLSRLHSLTEDDEETTSDESPSGSSKREMLKFAIPALGIYLTNPLLSNIDNAFVGRTVGPAGLAALSPATLCVDQAFYLFSFLSRAATGLVSRAYATKREDGKTGGNLEAAREAASPPLTMSLICGAALSLMYAFCTPALLTKLNVDPRLTTSATSYIHWRGAISWAALAQSVCLSLFMATRDAITPLKIIAGAAVFNIIGDALLCVWPLNAGCGGAAAATALATLLSSGWMVKSLRDGGLLPKLRIPTKKEMGDLLEFTGPLLAITFVRMAGFMNMQKSAMSLGVESLAGYQLCINLLVFFILFGEPLSQIGQTKLPSLIDAKDKDQVKATYKSILVLSTIASLGVGAVAYLTALFGSGVFSSNVGVQAVAQTTAPSLFFAVVATVMGIAVDGCMMASRDFGFMLVNGIVGFLLQAKLLQYTSSISGIFASFTARLSMYTVLAVGRTAFGFNTIGRVMTADKEVPASSFQ